MLCCPDSYRECFSIYHVCHLDYKIFERDTEKASFKSSIILVAFLLKE